MIYSDKQYGISSDELVKLKEALVATEEQLDEQNWVGELEIEGLKSKIADLEAEISHYDLVNEGEFQDER